MTLVSRTVGNTANLVQQTQTLPSMMIPLTILTDGKREMFGLAVAPYGTGTEQTAQ
jgi:hypothetical protein